MAIDPIQTGWLRMLISSYGHEHDWSSGEDPDATREMLAECLALANQLDNQRLSNDETDIHLIQDPDIPF